MKPAFYDKTFFNYHWYGYGIGSYKNTDNAPYMIEFSFSGSGSGVSGVTAITNLNNWSKVFGGNYSATIFDGINNFSIFTPEEYKKYWCQATGAKTYWSHWPDVYPSSNCY